MSQYYLMAQLPSLDGLGDGAALPITEAAFLENCGRFLDENTMAALRELSLTPPREPASTDFALMDTWNANERALRLALGSLRAGNMKKSFDVGGETLQAPLVQVARTAVEMGDPLAAERYLYEYRMNYVESIRPLDEFSDDAVFYYGLKLKLMERIRRFNEERGRDAYRNIYDSILHGDDRENEQ